MIEKNYLRKASVPKLFIIIIVDTYKISNLNTHIFNFKLCKFIIKYIFYKMAFIRAIVFQKLIETQLLIPLNTHNYIVLSYLIIIIYRQI